MAKNFFKIFEGISLVPRSADPSSPAEGDLQFSDGTARAKGLWEYKNSAWSTFGGSGGGFSVNTISGTQSLTNGETYIVNTSGGTATLTLPAVAANAYVYIKDSGSAESNNITVNTPLAETIDGNSNLVINSNLASVLIVCDGTNWHIL